MIKATKITDEELQEVQQLQKDFQIVTYQIGELSIAEHNIQSQLDNVTPSLFFNSSKDFIGRVFRL